eukprot:scaffold12319_cov112-Isochrysis_galbana.AAC.10
MAFEDRHASRQASPRAQAVPRAPNSRIELARAAIPQLPSVAAAPPLHTAGDDAAISHLLLARPPPLHGHPALGGRSGSGGCFSDRNHLIGGRNGIKAQCHAREEVLRPRRGVLPQLPAEVGRRVARGARGGGEARRGTGTLAAVA